MPKKTNPEPAPAGPPKKTEHEESVRNRQGAVAAQKAVEAGTVQNKHGKLAKNLGK